VALALLVAAPARADDAAAAKALFDHGLDEMKQGRYPAGCSAIAESYKLNPLPGALFTLAECEAKRGRIATAIKRYEEYAQIFVKLPKDKQHRQHGRDVLSKEQIGLLSAQVPKVTLLFDSPPSGVVATLDGVPLDRAALPGPFPVDPGDHVVFAQVQGGASVEKRFSVDKGEQKTVALTLKPLPSGPPVPDTASSSPKPLRIASFAVGGIGIGLIAVGAVTGGLALGKKSTVQMNCMFDGAHGIATCNQTGLDAGHAVTTLGAASTATFVVGTVALGAGIGLFVAGSR
jgi:hypothetical protein